MVGSPSAALSWLNQLQLPQHQEAAMHEVTMPAAITTRRRFLRRVAAGSAGLAALPLAGGLAPASAAPAASRRPTLRPPRHGPDEAYWRQVKAQFAIRDGTIPLNAANLCPAPRSVIDAVAVAMRDVEADVSFQNRAKYDQLRERVRDRIAAHLGASADEIAIVRNTSEGNNIVAAGLPLHPGEEVLLFDQNHATNNIAWEVRGARHGFTVRRVSVPADAAAPDAVLRVFGAAIGPRTRVIAFSDLSNSSGLRLPTQSLCALARERGIYTHVDGAQTWGALVRDLHALGCDSYAASAHKWFMGPKETGVLYVRADRIARLWPGVIGIGWGNAVEPAARGARKFETLGQRNDATIAGLHEAIALHELIGPAVIEARILELAEALKTGLAEMPGATLVTPRAPELSGGVVITRFAGADMRRLYERLYSEHGIAGASTGGLRLCPHVYSTLEDIERTLAAVQAILRSS
jgi:selenocysteine lyase/cysteine desulfurase